MKRFAITLSALIVLAGFTPSDSISQQGKTYFLDFTSSEDRQGVRVECACILTSSGCGGKLFWQLSGGELNSWTQEMSFRAGQKADVSAACYRGRNNERGGNGLCCEPSVDKDGIPDEKQVRDWYGARRIPGAD